MDIKDAERAGDIANTIKHIEHKIDVLTDRRYKPKFQFTTQYEERSGYASASSIPLTEAGVKAVTQAVLDDLAYQKAKLVEELQKLGVSRAT
jgi:hypothetical protein